jgi:hypothetical protein
MYNLPETESNHNEPTSGFGGGKIPTLILAVLVVFASIAFNTSLKF